ncbi:MAG: PKD domain-containing protein [Bacteroidota bacterium]|nr:PKD domain-containing protein [Bacteroidota bacterium]
MKQIIGLLFFFIFQIYANQSVGQTASITKGCVPLSVEFTSPTLNQYYWDFNDGTNSSLANPNHSFTKAGIYIVTLYEGQNGNKIGDIEIKVFADPIIDIKANITSGCNPLTVNFSTGITIDPEIIIQEFLWSFGDGFSSVLSNPTHTYGNAGRYTVSVRIKTNIGECDKTFLVNDFIRVSGVNVDFNLDKFFDCNVPADFNFTNLSTHDPSNTYSWNFGNGITSNLKDPGKINYDKPGSYTITLTLKDKNGCTSKVSKIINVGPPVFLIHIPDTVCVNLPTILDNSTLGNSYQWNFTADATPTNSSVRNPTVRFSTPGIKIISLSVSLGGNCKKDTSFSLFVEATNPTFTIDLDSACYPKINISLNALVKTYKSYIWNDTVVDDANYLYKFVQIQRDTFYRHRPDTIRNKLAVTSHAGCVAIAEIDTIIQRPNAILLPNISKGCAPLLVEFSDSSLSIQKISKWTLLYGDGSNQSFNNNNLSSHIYTKAGEYYVKLIIETEGGCIDTSEGFFIYVGDKINPNFQLDKTEICLGDSITFIQTNPDPRIDSWHVDTDHGRFNHCWSSTVASHKFETEPGRFDLEMTIEYNGCFTDVFEANKINVKGAKSNLSYMVNCASPYNIMFESKSINAAQIRWDFGDGDTSLMAMLTHFYPSRGSYTVNLIASDPASGCPADTNTQIVHIKEIKADFELPSKVCDNERYTLDASASVDVDSNCYKGFLWLLPNNRPRELGKNNIDHSFFIPGTNTVTLIVEDINGCRDTLQKNTRVFSMDPDFLINKDEICFPVDLQFTDRSIGDTTIVKYAWSFGSNVKNPSIRFQTPPPNNEITLTIEDAAGCVDMVTKKLNVYQPVSHIIFNKEPRFCVGETLSFDAFDFTQKGSFLHFNWDFKIFGKSDVKNPTITFDKSGNFTIILNYTEDASGCKGSDSLNLLVVDKPVANFSSTFDNQGNICYPAIFNLTNTSNTDGPVRHTWTVDNINSSNLLNPTFAFGKGAHEIKLLVTSDFGCADSITKKYVLVGPEGKMESDKTTICNGGDIKFNIADTSDVSQFEWDFGDGTTAQNVNPITHTFHLVTTKTIVQLILKSAETGCETIDSLEITIAPVIAAFERVDSITHCPTLVQFLNKSVYAQGFEWSFEDASPSIDSHPIVKFNSLGKKLVTLIATNAQYGCKDTIQQEIDLTGIEDIFDFPNVFSPNGDMRNDFFNVAVKPAFKDKVSVKNFKVFNRWGELIYNHENPIQGWDGRYKGVDAPVEIYAYFIEIDIEDCGSESRKGNVTIVR